MNDDLRTTGLSGRVMITKGIEGNGRAFLAAVIGGLRAFDTFTEENDPHGEHDFGAMDVEGERVFWKIDYYDRTLMRGSSDPADPSCTIRVLTIMLAKEY